MFRFDGAKIHFFPDILTVFCGFFNAAERERMKKKKRAAIRLPGLSGPPSLGLVQSVLKSDCCEYKDLQSAKSHFKCLYSLRSDSCVPAVASQQSWSGKSARAAWGGKGKKFYSTLRTRRTLNPRFRVLVNAGAR